MKKTKNKNKVSYWKITKKIAQSVREFKLQMILTPIFVALEVIMECIIPIVIAQLIDTLNELALNEVVTDEIARQAMDSILIYCSILLPLAVLSLIFGLLSGRFAATAALGLSKNLRHDMFEKIQTFSFENIDKYATSGLVTRITTDVYYVQMAVMNIIRIAVRGPLMIIFSLVMCFVLAPQLWWTFLIIIPIVAVALTFIILKASPIFVRVFDELDDLNDRIEENIKGMRTVKSYVRSDHEKQLFKKRADAVANNFIKADKIFVLGNPVMQFAIYLLITLCTWFGGNYILNGIMTLGSFNSLMLYGVQTLFSLMMLSQVLISITMATTSLRRIYEILTEVPTIKDNDNPIYEISDGSIDFENVSFKYKADAERFALSDVNLHIKSGETIGIIGGTGSAKSTLVNLISRLYDTTDGQVKVGGVNVKEYDLTTLRNNVAVVLQKNVLFSGSIKDNLKWGNENASDEQVIHASKLACADEFIMQFKDGYDHMIEQGGTNVSGGQKQRLCIARALLKNPKVLILDDSTSAVDTKTDAKIRSSFKQYIPEVTKFIIAQRIASVCDADRVIVMNDGKIDAFDTPDNLLKTNKIYQEVYYSQNKQGGDLHE